MKKTKIIATIGPASSSEEMLGKLMDAGVDVVRLNFSHDDRSSHEKVIKLVRSLDEARGSHTAILADLQGPKLRIGEVKDNKINLVTGENIQITTKEVVGTPAQISTNYKDFAKDVKPGEKVLLDDGKIALKVVATNGKDCVDLTIIHGGALSSKKGINLPNTRISLPCLTPKDLADLDFILEHSVDWIGLSFVRSAKDIKELRRIIDSKQKSARIVAKIEKPEAIEDIHAIIDASDGVMVARGDLGVEVPMQNVPIIQKRIINLCIKNAKPVIVATQMMESMIESITPTRAEVNDVANAVLDRTDAVMLSAETSVGKYPIQVVQAMVDIIEEVEKHDNVYYHEQAPGASDEERFISDSICYNACRLAKRVNAKAIITMTFSGYTGLKVSSQRPKATIFIFTGNRKILSMMNLVWGVKAIYYDKTVSTDHTIADIKYILKKEGSIKAGDFIINIASMPIAEMGTSNMLRLTKV
jgi:pyruvate kinase